MSVQSMENGKKIRDGGNGSSNSRRGGSHVAANISVLSAARLGETLLGDRDRVAQVAHVEPTLDDEDNGTESRERQSYFLMYKYMYTLTEKSILETRVKDDAIQPR